MISHPLKKTHNTCTNPNNTTRPTTPPSYRLPPSSAAARTPAAAALASSAAHSHNTCPVAAADPRNIVVVAVGEGNMVVAVVVVVGRRGWSCSRRCSSRRPGRHRNGLVRGRLGGRSGGGGGVVLVGYFGGEGVRVEEIVRPRGGREERDGYHFCGCDEGRWRNKQAFSGFSWRCAWRMRFGVLLG